MSRRPSREKSKRSGQRQIQCGSDGIPVRRRPAGIAEHIGLATSNHTVGRILSPYVPAGLTGWALDELGRVLAERGIVLQPMIRPWDRGVGSHTPRGFFQLKAEMPTLIKQPELFR